MYVSHYEKSNLIKYIYIFIQAFERSSGRYIPVYGFTHMDKSRTIVSVYLSLIRVLDSCYVFGVCDHIRANTIVSFNEL